MGNKLQFRKGARFIYCSVEWVVFKHFSNGNVNAVRVKDGFVSTFSEDEILNNCLLIQ